MTDQGKKLLEYANNIISLIDEAEEVICQSSEKVIRIGSSITIGNHLLP